ncbi:hypothetical protein HID58_033488 [Brassica napus]|uniref:Uncharacterized protein n=1 Tax=Brassica napus TaxID=3708 RepID=A0ABQ8BZD8_BRANA|nr:hypothetical protein HID58_033488 [Brassica napus]
MSNETKDLNNYHYTSSYNHYNNINSQNMSLPYSHEVVGGGGAIAENETRVSASPSSGEADHHHGENSGKSLLKREADDGGDKQRSNFINTPRSFSHDDLFRVPYSSMNVNPNYQQQQNHEFQHGSDYELLKEMFPSGFFKQEP